MLIKWRFFAFCLTVIKHTLHNNDRKPISNHLDRQIICIRVFRTLFTHYNFKGSQVMVNILITNPIDSLSEKINGVS